VNASLSEQVDKVCSISCCLSNSLLEENYATDKVLNAGSSKQKVSVGSSVGLVILHANRLEAGTNSARGFVSGEDTLSWGCDFTGGLNEFSFELVLWVDHLIFNYSED
jgi:hypothetical protein